MTKITKDQEKAIRTQLYTYRYMADQALRAPRIDDEMTEENLRIFKENLNIFVGLCKVVDVLSNRDDGATFSLLEEAGWDVHIDTLFDWEESEGMPASSYAPDALQGK